VVALKEPKPDTTYMFAYTSGTTGDPKGSMIPHSYYVGVCNFVDYFGANFTKDDITISYLPYAHIFE
jgi:long-chain acyl-CoA synthetase